MRVSLAQISPVFGDLEGNLNRTGQAVAKARAQEADLVVFPELSLTGYPLGQDGEATALGVQDTRVTSLVEEAGDISIVVGFHEDGDPRTYNSSAYFEGGTLLHLHRKLYLPTYDIFEERKHFSPGQYMRAFKTEFGRMAMLICNDAWQPTLGFLGVQDGARALIIPSNSSDSRFPEQMNSAEYWRDITKFYARMFECYVIFVNRVGKEKDLTFWGNSHVVNPLGQTVAEAPFYEEDLLTIDIDLDDSWRRRREVPLLKEARLSLLSRELNYLAEKGGDL